MSEDAFDDWTDDDWDRHEREKGTHQHQRSTSAEPAVAQREQDSDHDADHDADAAAYIATALANWSIANKGTINIDRRLATICEYAERYKTGAPEAKPAQHCCENGERLGLNGRACPQCAEANEQYSASQQAQDEQWLAGFDAAMERVEQYDRNRPMNAPGKLIATEIRIVLQEARAEAAKRAGSKVISLPIVLPEWWDALKRFSETTEDDESYDVPLPMMDRLAGWGVVRKRRGSVYETTLLGDWLLQKGPGAEQVALLEAVRAIRKSDCGGWLKDCTGVSNVTCRQGKEKRQELMRLLDALYSAFKRATGEEP